MIRSTLLVLSLVFSTAAHAQVPGMPASVVPKGEAVFAVADTDSQRFLAGNEAPGPQLKKGEAVTVVARAQGRVRFLVRGRFGWVPAAAVSSEPPPPEIDPAAPPVPPG